MDVRKRLPIGLSGRFYGFGRPLLDDFVDEAVFLGRGAALEVVALHVALDLFERLAGVLDVDLVQAAAQIQNLSRLDFDVGRLPLRGRCA